MIGQSAVYCEAQFNYFGSSEPKSVALPVIDGRTIAPTLDVEGFTLLSHSSSIGDWSDAADIDRRHAQEVGDLARDLSGSDIAIVYPAILRNPSAARDSADHAPIELVHSDFSEDYRAMATEPDRPYRNFLDPMLHAVGLTVDDVVGASRLAVLQLWRNTGPVRADRPLAFCDRRSITADRLSRLVVSHYAGEHLEFETMLFSAPPEGQVDRWVTFPEPTIEEVVAFRTYDSVLADAGDRFWTPHSAFADPSVRPGPATHRNSVEMRALCLWR